MARTPSTMLALGTQAPPFSLPDVVTGNTISLDDFAQAKGYLVAFICNHCPFVQMLRHELARFGREYIPQGLAMIAINANDADNFPEDSPEKMQDDARRFAYPFPYLYDQSQATAKAYQAACTPDFFLFDGERRLVYRGQFDGARPGNDVMVTGADMRQAVDALLSGQAITAEQKPSLGCNIKWKPGNEPDY
ncbi:thioredoxin family protein [Thiorhodospira sibirica]|uniref:thioredoxin family protein n=1 Tax=Thiorhodospira sibirica TaxID=154347 RepID=UPI00022C39E1|nr:thioredoxin family protein [Thiorhodospira sibirica]